VLQVGSQRIDKRLIGQTAGCLVRSALENFGSLRASPSQEFGGQTGLADARFAMEDGGLGPPLARGVIELDELCELVRAPDERVIEGRRWRQGT
jgi:hypothetical protein